ncbi:Peptidoglycan/LPS O-acetylase OafA/YrhL, contains acyltransferase and SGNH-hydrolase domains [Ekhidna lutea]|uniref:Peptidoglycan/LPS O-acetylase OafA/YrhL, contains acyltransferase and SGNH-hydrolase domains n=1 Tax=Ekhidna lutea TaxID=447679 RepID=A0A239J989_EKHLU|nr:acyltransferase [Ekhidna lutea]SNT01843.1 Peptidoglycan/LPS O-acetylase OafA/YrhL, contains acyltransferase and SGNH-hydrolase domains [Ekhidna lutea]
MKKVYFTNLDGLRFFAFFAVFLAHSFYSEDTRVTSNEIYLSIRELGHIGIFGVNFFFVLSGFLITYLLIQEKNENGKINLKHFYARRVLRIWPLYYTVIVIGFVLIPFIQREIMGQVNYEESANLGHYLLFVNNFSNETPSTAVLGILWSIAVEEQFYLVWPVIIGFMSFKRLPFLFSFIIIVSVLFRIFLIGYGYKHTLSCMSDLAIGSLFAYYSFFSIRFRTLFQSMRSWQILIIYLVGLGLFFIRDLWSEIPLLYLNERLLFSLFFAFVILEQTYSRSIFKIGKLKLISRLGQVTYGLYMLHFIAIYIVAKLIQYLMKTSLVSVLVIEPVISLLLAVILSYFSFYLLEKPFLNLKRKFGA